jgi:hypothetical protein
MVLTLLTVTRRTRVWAVRSVVRLDCPLMSDLVAGTMLSDLRAMPGFARTRTRPTASREASVCSEG